MTVTRGPGIRSTASRRRTPRRPRPASTDTAGATTVVAEAVQRLAVLLEAGVVPERAWQHLAATGDPVAGRVAAAGAGASTADALADAGGAWRQVAVAWRVSQTVGAPLAPSLRAIAAALREGQESRDDVAVALAEPVATARLIAWLPLVAVALGLLFGFDLGATVTHPLGVACLAIGTGLVLTARWWTRRLIAGAQPDAGIPGLQAELVAIALSGGVSLDRALSVVDAGGGGAIQPATAEILDLSRAAGAPAIDLLRASAAAARHHARTDGRLRAARLGSRLLVPLGVCTLPAFLLLGVGPMLLSVLTSEVLIL